MAIEKPNAGIEFRPQHLPGQTPVTPTKPITADPTTPQPQPTPGDAVAHDGRTKVGGEDQSLRAGAAVSPQLLAKLDRLAKSGKTGALVADAGDVDIDVAGNPWRLPDASTATTLGRIGTVLQGDDTELQQDALLVLAAAEETAWTAQREADEQLPDGARTRRSEALARVLCEAQKKLPARTRKIWHKVGEAFRQLRPTQERATGRREPAGAENPFFDGSATYGQPIETKWLVPQEYELWGFDSAFAGAITQGQLGDCYLLSTLAALAVKNPNILHDMIRYNADKKTFTVEFFEIEPYGLDGKNPPPAGPWEVRVKQPKRKAAFEVDASLLVDEESYAIGAGAPDVDSDGYIEIGINMIEKAFALYNNELRKTYPDYPIFGEEGYTGYNGIEGGYCDWVLQALAGEETGYDSIPASAVNLLDVFSAANTGETVMANTLGLSTNGSAAEAEQLAAALAQMGGTWPAGVPATGSLSEAQRNLVNAAIDDVWPDGLVPGHAYTVLGTCVVGGEAYAVMRNPWGGVEPQGPASGEDDGVFMMLLDDVERLFGGLFFDADAPTAGATSGPATYSNFAKALSAHLAAVQRHGADVGVNLGEGASGADTSVPSSDAVSIAHDIGAGVDPSRWAEFIGGLHLSGGTDINSVVQWVLREAYLENLQDLAFYAEKVKFFNEQKKAIRAQLKAWRQIKTKLAGVTDEDKPYTDLRGVTTPHGGDADVAGGDPDTDGTFGGFLVDSDPVIINEDQRAQEYREGDSWVRQFSTYDGEVHANFGDLERGTDLEEALKADENGDLLQRLLDAIPFMTIDELKHVLIAFGGDKDMNVDDDVKHCWQKFLEVMRPDQVLLIAGDTDIVKDQFEDPFNNRKRQVKAEVELLLNKTFTDEHDAGWAYRDHCVAQYTDAKREALGAADESVLAAINDLNERNPEGPITATQMAELLRKGTSDGGTCSPTERADLQAFVNANDDRLTDHAHEVWDAFSENEVVGATFSPAQLVSEVLGSGLSSLLDEIDELAAQHKDADQALVDEYLAEQQSDVPPDGNTGVTSDNVDETGNRPEDSESGEIDIDPDDGSIDAVMVADAYPILRRTGEKITTVTELDAAIEELEEELATVGEDAQLANFDLQNMVQKQQQTIQMLSNISKTLHDSAMAVIRKIGS